VGGGRCGEGGRPDRRLAGGNGARWKTVTPLGEGRSNNADPLAERGRCLKIKDNCWAPTEAALTDFGKMADGHPAAREVVGNDKIVSIKSDQLD